MATTLRRIRVTAALKVKNYPHLQLRAWAIYNAMLANAASFPNPSPSLAALLALVTSFELAQQATVTRAKGTVPARNAKAALVVTALESEVTMVQGLCDANPEQAEQLIANAGMVAMDIPDHDKQFLEPTLTTTAGTVHLAVNMKMLTGGSRKRPTVNWQSSPDGKTWTNQQSTPLGDTDIPNLPMMAEAWFRVSVTLGKVTGVWSQSVSIFVGPPVAT
jgi:hypothetical protein